MLNISEHFRIDNPELYANNGNAILGIRGSGKSYTAMKIAEQLHASTIPFVAFDPTGIWRNLQYGVNGHPGLPIVVAGGENCDIRLTVDNCQDIVKAAMKQGISLVIDLYSRELATKSSWIKIVKSSIETLMYDNPESETIRHIFIEEAAEFCPQKLQRQHNEVYSQIEKLARIGRNFGLGYTIINQRAEEVNKAILELCTFSFLHKQVGRNSLNAIKDWMNVLQLLRQTTDMIMKTMPTLTPGEWWLIGSGDPQRFHTSTKDTFHPDPRSTVKPPRMNDVTKEEIRENIKLIEMDLHHKSQLKSVNSALPMASSSQLKEYEQKIKSLVNENKLLREQNEQYKSIIDNVRRATYLANTAIEPGYSPDGKIEEFSIVSREDIAEVNDISPADKYEKFGDGLGRMIYFCAASKKTTRIRLALMAGLSHKSGTFHTYISRLKKQGLIEVQGGDITITEKGLKQAGPVDPTPTGKKFLDMWCTKLGGKMSAILYALYESPSALSKEQVGNAVGLSHTSGTFNTYISRLRSLGLITDITIVSGKPKAITLSKDML